MLAVMKTTHWLLPVILLALAAPVQAQSDPEFTEVVPLSELVRKGVITQEQAELIRNSGAVGIEPRVVTKPQVKQLTVSGWAQFSYDYIAAHDDALPNPASTNTFRIQNLVMGIGADLGSGWSGSINANFANGFGARNYLDSAYIKKKWDDYGAVYFGYKKARFGLEQYTSSRLIPAVQRSIATSYFTSGYSRIGAAIFPGSPAGLGTTRLGLGARRIGLAWSGVVPGFDGFSYYAEVTNGYQDFAAPANTGQGNSIGYQGGLQYEWAAKHDNELYDGLVLDLGVNATYQPEGNSLQSPAPVGALANVPLNRSNSITGIDPFVEASYEHIHLVGEFMGAWVERGKASGTRGPASVTGYNTADAFPIGVNAFLTYVFDDTIEPVFRFSMVDSDGAGVNPSVVSAGPAFGGPAPGGAFGTVSPVGVGFFDSAQAYYFGFNWYILGNNAKLSAGYEFINFQDRWNGFGFGGPDATEEAVRVRMQLVF